MLFQGTPDEVFTAPRMRELYDLGEGSFNPLFGSVELARHAAAPEVFVVAGGGSGAACMRALAREGVPFAAGVLHEHDSDGMLAASLATEAVLERDFEPVGERALSRAREVLLGCRALVCCVGDFRPGNARNAELVEAARAAGIPVFRNAGALLAARGTGTDTYGQERS